MAECFPGILKAMDKFGDLVIIVQDRAHPIQGLTADKAATTEVITLGGIREFQAAAWT